MARKNPIIMGHQEPQPGWSERAKVLCDPSEWEVNVKGSKALLGKLSEGEVKRMLPKIQLVTEATQYMLASMLKGVLKYPMDDWDIDVWVDHLIGEGADQLNYQILLANSWRKFKRDK